MRNIGVYIAVALTGYVFIFFTLFSLEEPQTETNDSPSITFDAENIDYGITIPEVDPISITTEGTRIGYLQSDSMTMLVNGASVTFTYDEGTCISICVEGGTNTGIYTRQEFVTDSGIYTTQKTAYSNLDTFSLVIGGVNVEQCEPNTIQAP